MAIVATRSGEVISGSIPSQEQLEAAWEIIICAWATANPDKMKNIREEYQ